MTVRIINADVMEGLRMLPDESVHTVVTSPPYWGLRDYGVAGQIGLEPTPVAFVDRLVEVFREVKRVLRDDGTLWLNLGDSYASIGRSERDESPGVRAKQGMRPIEREVVWLPRHGQDGKFRWQLPGGIKPKDLCGIPWRVAFALQDDGWWLRQDIIWAKPNPMPESVTDRCTKAHEYVFLLTKDERYFYDAEAIKEASTTGDVRRPYAPGVVDGRGNGHDRGGGKVRGSGVEYRNKRSVWTIATTPYSEAHFATFPTELPELCIKAGTSEKGCCTKCGAPWKRNVEAERVLMGNSAKAGRSLDDLNASGKHRKDDATGNKNLKGGPSVITTTIGWSPSCSCDAGVAPCMVLDPFGGAGTTALVADRLGRDAISIELNPEYAEMQERRIARDRLERGQRTMEDVAKAKLPATPLEALMRGDP